MVQGNRAQFDDVTMYNAWIAHNRNAVKAAKSIGLEPSAMHWHVRTKNFEQRYLLEYGGLAEGTMKAGIVKAMLAIPDVVNELLEMATESHRVVNAQTGEEYTDARIMMAKIKAVDTLVKFLPTMPEKIEDVLAMAIETHGEMVNAAGMSPEEEIRMAIESNIIDAAEARTRRNSNAR
jgi:hypothetical protein